MSIPLHRLAGCQKLASSCKEAPAWNRGATLWIAALPPSALHTARQSPRWPELDQADRLYPTALTALRAFRAR
jgi:hypothetical protein